jgi:uncharacterized protein (TIGR02679 family)
MTGFAHPGLERLWRQAHARRQSRGAAGDARIVLSDVDREEAFALDGLPWPGRPKTVLPGTTFTTTLSRLEAAVSAAGGELDVILTDAIGTAPRDLRAETRAQRDRRLAFGSWLAEHPVVQAHPGLGGWVANVRRVGVPGPTDKMRVAKALDVIAALPWSPLVARSTLAAHVLEGDAHGLDPDTELGRLCATLLSWRAGNSDRSLDPIERRDLWLGYGVEVDPLSCTVLTLGLVSTGATPVARALHVMRGHAVALTYAQLRAEALLWPAGATIFSCENPVVVRTAERALGASCPPLVCTGGWPNAAVLALFDELRAAGATIHHHGDHDPSGFKILDYLTERLQVTPWRFVRGAEAVAVPEELALDMLLEDLKTSIGTVT